MKEFRLFVLARSQSMRGGKDRDHFSGTAPRARIRRGITSAREIFPHGSSSREIKFNTGFAVGISAVRESGHTASGMMSRSGSILKPSAMPHKR